MTDAWEPNGIEPVADTLELLGDEHFDFSAELLELQAMELADRDAAFLESLPGLFHEETRRALEANSGDGFVDWLSRGMKTIHTLREGYYRLLQGISPEYGGGVALLVSPTDSFEMEAHLHTLADFVEKGQFKRSRSLKKIAFINNNSVSRKAFQNALNAAGLSCTAYMVEDFDDIQDQLHTLKRVDQLRSALAGKPIKLPLDVVLTNKPLCKSLYAFLLGEKSGENLGFYLQAAGSPLKNILNDEHRVNNHTALYNSYIDEDGEFSINISDSARKAASATAPETTNFQVLANEMKRNLTDPVNRWKITDAFYAVFMTNKRLHKQYIQPLL